MLNPVSSAAYLRKTVGAARSRRAKVKSTRLKATGRTGSLGWTRGRKRSPLISSMSISIRKISNLSMKIKRLQAIQAQIEQEVKDRKSTRLNSSHVKISYAVFCLKKTKAARQSAR